MGSIKGSSTANTSYSLNSLLSFDVIDSSCSSSSNGLSFSYIVADPVESKTSSIFTVIPNGIIKVILFPTVPVAVFNICVLFNKASYSIMLPYTESSSLL